MTKLIGRGSWTVLLLLYIGFSVLTWRVPAFAAELKDVRVGEYKGFTRIVFELDEPAIKPDIKVQSSNHLLVTFNKTSANLVRHIPVERSPHVDDIQFWRRKATLSTLLIFDYPHIRLESFRLSRPPRFAVDVFPVAQPVEEKSTGPAAPAQTAQPDDKKKASEAISKQTSVKTHSQSEPAQEQSVSTSESSDKGAPPKLTEATVSLLDSKQPLDGNAPTPEQGIASPDDVDNRTLSEITTEKVHSPGPRLPIEDNKSASSENGGPSSPPTASGDSSKAGSEEYIQSPMPPSPPSEPTNGVKQKSDNIAQTTPPPNNRLQFYLVIILVIITIAILLLLLLMLLTRHQLFYDKDALSAAEMAQHQDKNIIAKLDSNIKEQLKRYDEA